MHYDSFTPEPELEEQRSVTQMDPREMYVVRSMHRIAQKHNIVLACAECRQPFQGLNSPIESMHSIVCGCRELRAPAPRAVTV